MIIRKCLFALALSFLFSSVYAQKATVHGNVVDQNDETLPLGYATVKVINTKIGSFTDEEGKFEFTIDPGSYKLLVTYIGYENQEIPFTVKPGERLYLKVLLKNSSAKSLGSVVIKAERRKSSEAAVMEEVKEAKQVVSAISAEQMSKGTDGNAAQAIQRVPGVTINDGKFVMVRGLNERYNNVFINGIVAPSTETDRRTFSFDLIPVSALDKMVIHKTGAAYLPGDFAGGIIKVTTSETFSNFNKVSVGIGYRTNSTFGDYYQADGNWTDWLGFDKSVRTLPSNFPSTPRELFDNTASAKAANQLSSNFKPNQYMTPVDLGLSFAMGRIYKFKNKKELLTINSISYSSSYENYSRLYRNYEEKTGDQAIQVQQDFIDATYNHDIRINAVSNWLLRLNDRNRISFKTLFNQLGENNTVLREGRDLDQRQGELMRNYQLSFNQRTIISSQFTGEHDLSERLTLDWVIGGNYISDVLPDLRRFRTTRPENNENTPFNMIAPPSPNPFDAGRFFANLKEFTTTQGINFTYKIPRGTEEEEFSSIILKSGFLGDFKDRDFSSRYFSYLIPGSVTPSRTDELTALPLDEIFNSSNVSPTEGWVLREGTAPRDAYFANNLLMAGYLYAEVPINHLDISGGIRAEYNDLRIIANDGLKELNVSQPILSLLPSLNLGYNFSEKMVLRGGYSRTVNRPEFREIAPFLFYDFELGAEIEGNADLTTATIDNLDMRFEFYPTKGETMSIGGFYKNLQNPIEYAMPIVSQQPRFRYINSDKAYIYGAEIEVKKSLHNVTPNVPILKNMSVNFNASYIFSEVDLGDQVAGIQEQTRALQGQSPYVINLALNYELKESGWASNLIYNRFGDRIFAVGNDRFRTIYELARNQLDYTISKTIKNSTYKIGVSNFLNSPFRFYQDTDRNNLIDDNDDPIWEFKNGAVYTIQFTHKF
jgi:outer membrane receptor for ferrienterochelin and colicin